MDAAAQAGHQQGDRPRNAQEALRGFLIFCLLACLLGGCISPPNRDRSRDREMANSKQLLSPEVRGPVDAQRKTPDDPGNPPLKEDVPLLSSKLPLERIQADNRLKQAGARGLLAVADFLTSDDAEPEKLDEALRFVSSADFASLDAAASARVREALAHCLAHKDAGVRVEAARALQVHGPGAQRTAFLTAIGDDAKRVRWAVVRRFGDHPEELDKAQRLILLSFLDAGSREDFLAADQDKDGKLTRREYKGLPEHFDQLDVNHDGAVALQEWVSPYPSAVRADVFALLLRIHDKLTPNERPLGYNPWLPSSDQLDVVADWKDWNNRVSEKTANEENK